MGTMNRRQFLGGIGGAFAALTLPAWAPAAGPAERKRRPNFVFVFADDLGWGDLGCYGNRQIRTPHLDELAKNGTLFTQFYVNGSVCSPSRTAIMTGHFPARYAIHGHLSTHRQNKARAMPDWLDPKVPNVAALLKDAGYATAHIGKWHLGSGVGAPDVRDYGFDFVGTGETGGAAVTKADPYFRARSTALFVDEALQFIRNHRERPFYVQLWTLVPHATLHPTDEQMKPYERFAPRGVPYKGVKQIYYASVTDLDTQIGRLVKRIDELGLADDTVIAFSSDNGPEDLDIGNAVHSGIGSTGPFRGRKRSLYEGGIRVPFIVRWPNHVPAGKVDDTSVIAGVDWLSTICRLAGVTLAGDLKVDGQDMSPALLGEPRQRTKPLMWQWRFRIFGHTTNKSPMLAVREGKWKLLMNPDRSRVELYDIPNDPTEVDNLADRHPEVVRRLSEQLLTWQKTLPAGPVEATAGSNAYPWP